MPDYEPLAAKFLTASEALDDHSLADIEVLTAVPYLYVNRGIILNVHLDFVGPIVECIPKVVVSFQLNRKKL